MYSAANVSVIKIPFWAPGIWFARIKKNWRNFSDVFQWSIFINDVKDKRGLRTFTNYMHNFSTCQTCGTCNHIHLDICLYFIPALPDKFFFTYINQLLQSLAMVNLMCLKILLHICLSNFSDISYVL